MMIVTKKRALAAAAALAMLPAAAWSQNIADQANEVTQQAEEVQQQADELANQMDNGQELQHSAREDRDGFDWGWLGLLGLAGLLGLRKRDDDRDIHVDNRHTTRT